MSLFHTNLQSDWGPTVTNSIYFFTHPFSIENIGVYLLALPVLQIEMRIEVDEYPLVWTRRGYHPHASLGRGVGLGVSGRGEVVGG